MLNYLGIINQHITPGTLTSKIYLVHAILVTNKALAIGRRLNLSLEQLEFIEAAAMLHDIGVVKVKSEKMACTGDLPYIAHGVAGAEILRQHDLGDLALVAARHVGVGLTAQEILARDLPLPAEDMVPISIEERIITYADLFFSKREATLWIEETPEQIENELAKYGQDQVATFHSWHLEFGND